MSGPVQSFRDPTLTPPDFWTKDADYVALLSVLSDEEQNHFGCLLENLTDAWRYGRSYKEPARELAEWLLRIEQDKRARP